MPSVTRCGQCSMPLPPRRRRHRRAARWRDAPSCVAQARTACTEGALCVPRVAAWSRYSCAECATASAEPAAGEEAERGASGGAGAGAAAEGKAYVGFE